MDRTFCIFFLLIAIKILTHLFFLNTQTFTVLKYYIFSKQLRVNEQTTP